MKARDLTGQKFGFVTAMHRVPNQEGSESTRWLCKCDCGNEIELLTTNLMKKERIYSCGCQSEREYHGLTYDPLYGVYKNMFERCHRPKNVSFKYYGEREIKICVEWNSFQAFYDWAMANGYQKGLQLDRINVDGNYEPSNCRWVTIKENNRNKRNNNLNAMRVRVIRHLLKKGLRGASIARKYMITPQAVCQIGKNKAWV